MTNALDLIGIFEATYVRPRPGRTLIVGSKLYAGRQDRRLLFSNVVGVDMLAGDGVDVVVNLEGPLPKSLGVFDHVECISVLEHSCRPWLLAANLCRLMVRGGTIFLSVPFVWRVHAYPDDYFRFTASGVRVLFKGIEWQQLLYASDNMRESFKLRAITESETGMPYLPRTSILGFGVKP